MKKAKRARHSYPRQIGLILTLSDKNFSSQGAVFYSSSLALAAKHVKWKGRGCDSAPIRHQSAIAGERRGKKATSVHTCWSQAIKGASISTASAEYVVWIPNSLRLQCFPSILKPTENKFLPRQMLRWLKTVVQNGVHSLHLSPRTLSHV